MTRRPVTTLRRLAAVLSAATAALAADNPSTARARIDYARVLVDAMAGEFDADYAIAGEWLRERDELARAEAEARRTVGTQAIEIAGLHAAVEVLERQLAEARADRRAGVVADIREEKR